MKGTKLTTWQTPSGARINICPACEDKPAPRNDAGEEYCQVYHALRFVPAGRCEHPEHGGHYA